MRSERGASNSKAEETSLIVVVGVDDEAQEGEYRVRYKEM